MFEAAVHPKAQTLGLSNSKENLSPLLPSFQSSSEASGINDSIMAPPPGPYSGTSTLALVARASTFSFGLVYGNMKLKYLKAKAKSQRKAEASAHH
ncbi:hypothetical protein SAY87_007336 [Trapa incisa]|uniref:ATP synthase subunit e, mitochondrial n=1 Tax=Trapa incisa TaxID=236973 RepID=A0AAN7K0U4_9MYRT|nr:hypothetical protein SAY87_007336 [Trapa incisa]